MPVLDGSAAPFVFLIDCAGIVEQSRAAPTRSKCGGRCGSRRRCLRRTAPPGALRAGHGAVDRLRRRRDRPPGAVAAARPPECSAPNSPAPAPSPWPRRSRSCAPPAWRRGGSLDNAVVVDRRRVLNPGGLRMPDEFARHKLLDAVGDLALAGAPLRGRFVAHRSGHALNNRLLRALFADAANWRMVAAGRRGGRALPPCRSAGCRLSPARGRPLAAARYEPARVLKLRARGRAIAQLP